MTERAPAPDRDETSPYASLEDLTVGLVLRAPFFGHVLAGLEKRLTRGETTLRAHGAKVVLEIGDEVLRTTRARARGVMKHELCHLLLEHPTRRAEHTDAPRFDLAADLVVGPMLDPGERGESDPIPEWFPGFPAEATVDVFYALLPSTPPVELASASVASASAASVGGVGTVEELSGAGGDAPSDDGASDDDEGPNGDAHERVRGPRGHEAWADFGEGTVGERALREAFVRRISEAAYDAARRESYGRAPGAFLRALAALHEQRGSLDWRVALRRFHATSERTRRVGTLHRASKRYGTVPGSKSKRECRIVVVIDTSGSISGDDLARFGAELRHIARAGAEVRILACDAAVRSDEPFRGTLTHLVGGGGTSLDAGLVAADAHTPDGIVYFTDGFVGSVTFRPRAPVLWLLTPAGIDPESPEAQTLLRGRRVKMR